jgi:hypothetical protein
MVPAVRAHPILTRVVAVLASMAILAGCGSSVAGDLASSSSIAAEARENASACPKTVLETVGRVLMRVYREGVLSERTAAAEHLIERSKGLVEAVEHHDVAAVKLAARTLLKTGHMTNLRVVSAGQTLVQAGGPALAPLQGTLTNAAGAPIATYSTSVWSDSGFLSEARGVTEGLVALRKDGRSIGDSLALAPGALPDEGTITSGGVLYRYTSFPATVYPSGPVRVYVLRSVRSTANSCGTTHEDTVLNTLHHVANLIYAAETGARLAEQVERVQRNTALREAVALRDPLATEVAIDALLNEHIVRMRVSVGGKLLSDVGGPYVLAPATAPLTLGGRTIGSVEISIQDDEGYLRRARRLADLDVLMYMHPNTHPELVKNSLGPNPGDVPASGGYTYRGRSFRVFTVNAEAFPSGPLTIRVLVPDPYLG